MDSPVLDGLPRDWPHDMAPGHNSPSNSPHSDKSQASSPQRTDNSLPPPTNTEHTVSDHEADRALPPSPSLDAKPLPETPCPEPAPMQDESRGQGTAVDGVVPPTSYRVRSKLDDPGIKDLGWDDRVATPPVLVQGMTNEHLFMLVRRFNKVRVLPYHIITTTWLILGPRSASSARPSRNVPSS